MRTQKIGVIPKLLCIFDIHAHVCILCVIGKLMISAVQRILRLYKKKGVAYVVGIYSHNELRA